MLVGSHTARRPDWPAVHVHTSAGAARVEHNRELSAIVSWRRTLAASTAVVVPPVEKARQQHNPDQHHEQAADEIFALPWNQTRRRCRRTCTTSRPTGTVVSQRSGSVCGFNVLQHSKPRSVLLHRNAPPHDGRKVQLCTTTKFTPVLPACQCDRRDPPSCLRSPAPSRVREWCRMPPQWSESESHDSVSTRRLPRAWRAEAHSGWRRHAADRGIIDSEAGGRAVTTRGHGQLKEGWEGWSAFSMPPKRKSPVPPASGDGGESLEVRRACRVRRVRLSRD